LNSPLCDHSSHGFPCPCPWRYTGRWQFFCFLWGPSFPLVRKLPLDSEAFSSHGRLKKSGTPLSDCLSVKGWVCFSYRRDGRTPLARLRPTGIPLPPCPNSWLHPFLSPRDFPPPFFPPDRLETDPPFSSPTPSQGCRRSSLFLPSCPPFLWAGRSLHSVKLGLSFSPDLDLTLAGRFGRELPFLLWFPGRFLLLGTSEAFSPDQPLSSRATAACVLMVFPSISTGG